jgi:spore coat protein CotF
MNDRLLLDNMLLLLKSTVEVYVHGSLESSTKEVHNALKSNLDTIIKLQDELYKKMTECGWYVIQNIEAKEIKKTLKKVNQN